MAGFDVDEEFSFEPIVFNWDNDEKIEAASAKNVEDFNETSHDEVEETKDLPLVIKSEPDYVENAMEKYSVIEANVKDEVKQKKKKSIKVQKKIKTERIIRKYSEEDENAANSLMQIDETGLYICTYPGCNKKWSSKSGMKSHIRTTHLNLISYQCEECVYVSKYRHALKAHVLAVHEGVTHTCEFCGYEAKYKTNILSHIKFVHKKVEKLQCHLCEYQAPKKYLLDYHIQGMHEKTALQCDQCSFTTTWGNALKKHVAYHHDKKEKAMKCDSCDFVAAFPFELKKHMYLQHGGGTTLNFDKDEVGLYSCDQCEYSSLKVCNLKTHIYKKHVL